MLAESNYFFFAKSCLTSLCFFSSLLISPASAKFPLLLALLCSNASLRFNQESQKWETVGNSSECPLVVAAAKAGLKVGDQSSKSVGACSDLNSYL